MPRKRGGRRPLFGKRMKQIDVALPDGEMKRLRTLADQMRVPMAFIAREALIEYLDRHDGQGPKE